MIVDKAEIAAKLMKDTEPDMVDVIRCCDCKHYAGAVFGRAGYLCNKFDSSVKPDGFCAWAEPSDA